MRPHRQMAHSYWDEVNEYRNRRPVAAAVRPNQLPFVASVVVLYIFLGWWILSLLGVIR